MWQCKKDDFKDETKALCPVVLSTDPTNGETNVVVNKQISATFNVEMDSAAINASTFEVMEGANQISGTVTYSGFTARFTPNLNLKSNTVYEGRITTGAHDPAENSLEEDYIWSFTTGAMADTTRPMVILTDPFNVESNVTFNKIITATFNEAMDSLTMNGASFTLKDGPVTIAGNISYANNTVSFAPTNPLDNNKTYVATITNSVTDVAGNNMMNDYVWSFNTQINLGPQNINLDCAADFAVIGGSAVTNTGNSVVDGDLGLSPGSAINGFPPGQVINGSILINDPKSNAAKICLTDAYNNGAGRSNNVIVSATGLLGGLTLAPGLYKSAPGSFTIIGSDLILDGQGDVNSVWIFQMPSSTLTVGNGIKVTLMGGAQAGNIYWIVGTSATIGTTAEMKGNILADQSITLQTGASLIGRALTRIAAVTLDNNAVTKP